MHRIRAKSKTSYAVSVAAALIVARGIESLIQAMAMPLEAPVARLINFLLVRGWRNVVLLSEAPYPLALVGSTTLSGIVLVTIGLLAGSYVVSLGAISVSAANEKPWPQQGRNSN